MSTPRTDIEFAAASRDAKYAEDITVKLLNHARQIETELNQHREALESLAYWSRNRAETRESLRDRIAAALRDLTKPPPEVQP